MRADAGSGGAASGVLHALMAPIYIIAGMLMAQGGFLAYYLPAVPFIFWSFGVLGWLLLIVESMIAAPLWAVSHAVPEGEGFAGRYALQGWQMFVNVIFRPILLTVGLLISLMLMHVICHFALVGYKYANLSIVDSTSMVSITGFLFTNLIMIALAIALAHKSHELIYETADNVMKWIGFGTTALGSVKSEGMVEGAVKGGGGDIKTGADAMVAARKRNPDDRTPRRSSDADNGGADVNGPKVSDDPGPGSE